MVMTYVRPREKLERNGVASLYDHELLQLLLGSGSSKRNVRQLARKLLKVFRHAEIMPSFDTLRSIDGIGPAKAATVTAAFEISRRFGFIDTRRLDPSSPKQGQLLCEVLSGNGTRIASSLVTLEDKTEAHAVQECLRIALLSQGAQVCITDAGTQNGSLDVLDILQRERRFRIAAQAVGLRVHAYRHKKPDEDGTP